MSAKCGRDESCTGKLRPISPKGPKFVAQTDFCVHTGVDEEFVINGIQPKYLTLLLTGKFRKGVTEWFRLKRINHKR